MFGQDLPEQAIKAIKGCDEDGQQEALQGPSCNGSGVGGDRDGGPMMVLLQMQWMLHLDYLSMYLRLVSAGRFSTG